MDSQPEDTSYSEFFPDIPAGETDFAQSEWAATVGHHDSSEPSIQISDYIVRGTTRVSKGYKNKCIILRIAEINNSQFFEETTSKVIENVYKTTSSQISHIVIGLRNNVITEKLSRIQPTPIEWLMKLDESLFENADERLKASKKKPIIDHIFTQCSTYQTALQDGNYMHKPLPPKAPAGTSYLEMYMPGLKGLIKGDLTPKACMRVAKYHRSTAVTADWELTDELATDPPEHTVGRKKNTHTGQEGTVACTQKKARTISGAKKNRFNFEQTIQIWNSRFDPSLTASRLSLIYEVNESTIYSVLNGSSRAIITKRLSTVRPTPINWFKSIDDALFEKANLKSNLDNLEKIIDNIFSHCPDYQIATSGDEYMHKALDVSETAMNQDLFREEYMPDALKCQEESICTETAHLNKAERNKNMFKLTLEIFNSIFFENMTDGPLSESYTDTAKNTIGYIRCGKRRHNITKHLSQSQPTPVHWVDMVPVSFFVKINLLNLYDAHVIFEQSTAYQEAIRGGDYMHNPLPSIKPEGFSYWKTYMPSLKGVEGDLTPK